VKTRQSLDSRKLAKHCRDIAIDKKAEDVIILDVRKISNVTDYFLLCSGRSEPHLKAIADELVHRLRDLGCHPYGRDGYAPSRWIVIDFNDVIVHIFHPDLREHYGLEALWGDAKRVK
jgi:ribosome-associated protein